MADHSSDNASTAAAAPAAHPDADLVALVEKRFAARVLSRDADDDDADAAYDGDGPHRRADRVNGARTLDGIRVKASICRDIAYGDAELAWPMLSLLMARPATGVAR